MEKLWEKLTLCKLLDEAVEAFPDKMAAIDIEQKLTYMQLELKVSKLSGFFKSKNLKKGDFVILQLANSVMFEIVIFALFRLGAVPILILPAHREHVIDAICDKTRPTVYITMNNFYGIDCEKNAMELAKNHNSIANIFTQEKLKAILDNKETYEYEKIQVKPEDLAFLSLSGGTTGVPKLIPRTHGDYAYNAITTAKHCKLTEKDVNLSAIPVAHNFAFGTPGMIGTVYAGGINVFCEYPSPVEICELIEKYKVTVMSLVPAVVNLCNQYLEIDTDVDISSLRYVMVGGALFTSDQAELTEKNLGCRVVQVYGMSEGMTFITDIDADAEVRFFTQGKPCAVEDEFLIVDDDFNEVADGVEGEVIVKGPYTITAYYKEDEANKKSFKNGYYRPGDKGYRHETGNIIITGRVKEMINRAGEKIMPVEIEKYFSRIPSVLDCVAVGIKDILLGQAICVFYRGSSEISIQTVSQFFRNAKVEDCCIPDRLVRVEEWPLTAVGKIDKSALKGMACND